MKCNKNTILFTASIVGASIAFIAAMLSMRSIEQKTDLCYVIRKKAKKALKEVEDRI